MIHSLNDSFTNWIIYSTNLDNNSESFRNETSESISHLLNRFIQQLAYLMPQLCDAQRCEMVDFALVKQIIPVILILKCKLLNTNLFF